VRAKRKEGGVVPTYRLVDNDGAETGFRTPTLAEALAWAEGRAILQLDIKRGVDIAEVTRFVAASGARDRAAIIVYSLEDAVAASQADPAISISVGIEDEAAFEALMEAGVPAERLMAWTGVLEGPRPELWALLDEAGVPAAGGSLWTLDGQVLETGDAGIYAELAGAGLDVLSSDLHRLAYETIEARQDGVLLRQQGGRLPPLVHGPLVDGDALPAFRQRPFGDIAPRLEQRQPGAVAD